MLPAGMIAPLLLLVVPHGNGLYFTTLACAAVVWVGALILGVKNRQGRAGKVLAIGAGALLLGLCAFLLLVLALVWGADHGAPM